MQESLHEKDTLLREIHHRVKNNLAVISSLLFLQSTRTDDRETQAMLEESQQRVRSMALVHETLYRSSNLSAVEFADYARALCEEASRSLRAPGQEIAFAFELEPVTLPIDIAIPCGLILNELITNAFKHGFPDGRSGAILAVADDVWANVLRTDRRGPWRGRRGGDGERNSLGLTLVQALTKQVDGEFALHSSECGHARGTSHSRGGADMSQDPGEGRPRLLIVEDEALIATELRQRLTRNGYCVVDRVEPPMGRLPRPVSMRPISC